VLKLSYVTVLC